MGGATRIGNRAVQLCTELTSVGNQAFPTCNKLISIIYNTLERYNGRYQQRPDERYGGHNRFGPDRAVTGPC